MASADAARLDGRAARRRRAVATPVLKGHRSDPRAPLAAFTLGRLLLMELGEPRQAAAAFADAQALAPQRAVRRGCARARGGGAPRQGGGRGRRPRPVPATISVCSRTAAARRLCAPSAAASEPPPQPGGGRGGRLRPRWCVARDCGPGAPGTRGAGHRRAGCGRLLRRSPGGGHPPDCRHRDWRFAGGARQRAPPAADRLDVRCERGVAAAAGDGDWTAPRRIRAVSEARRVPGRCRTPRAGARGRRDAGRAQPGGARADLSPRGRGSAASPRARGHCAPRRRRRRGLFDCAVRGPARLLRRRRIRRLGRPAGRGSGRIGALWVLTGRM